MQILEESQIFKSPLNSKSIFNGRLLKVSKSFRMTMNYGVGWKLWIFHSWTENVMLWFFFGEKALRSTSKLVVVFRFWTHLLLRKVSKKVTKKSQYFISCNNVKLTIARLARAQTERSETFLNNFQPLCLFAHSNYAQQRNRTKRFFRSLKTEALPESLSCGIWGFCQSFSIWLCASFCQSGSRHASWFFQRIFSYHFLQRKKPSLPPGFKHIVNLTGNSTQVWPARNPLKAEKILCLPLHFFFERSWHFKVEKTKRENGETTKIPSVLHDWNWWDLWEKNDTWKIPSKFQLKLLTTPLTYTFFVVPNGRES